MEAGRPAGSALRDQLAADGYEVALALTAAHARVLAANCRPALMLLGGLADLREPIELLAEIRRTSQRPDGPWPPGLPVIVLGATGELEMLRAFDAGADDYVSSPATYIELRARIRALLRRASADAEASRPLLRAGSLTVDVQARTATLDRKPLDLRRMEFELLAQLARDPEVVWPRQRLLQLVWGYRASACSRTVDSHASRLRRKLDPDGTGRWVVAVRGVGYRLI